MFDFAINQILPGLFLLTIGAIAPKSWKSIKTYFSITRHLRKVYRFDDRSRINVIIPTIHDHCFSDKEMIEFTSPLESTYAIKHFYINLLPLIKDTRLVRVFFSDELPPEALEHDLIIIGGPVYNHITAKFFLNVKPAFSFDEYNICSSFSGNSYSAISTSGKIVQDYCAVYVDKNPWNKEKNIILFAGSRGFGSIGATEFLDSNLVKKAMLMLREKYSSKKPLFMIIKIGVDHLNSVQFKTVNPEVIECFQ